MRRALIRILKTNLRFRRWSRAKYAAFVSVHRQVTMGQLASSLADRFYAKQALLHGGLISAVQVGISEEAFREITEEDDFLSVFLEMDKYAFLSIWGISQREASVDASKVVYHLIFLNFVTDGCPCGTSIRFFCIDVSRRFKTEDFFR